MSAFRHSSSGSSSADGGDGGPGEIEIFGWSSHGECREHDDTCRDEVSVSRDAFLADEVYAIGSR
jgi:hypothetical protein